MASPSPEPPARDARAKGWNSFGCIACGMPGPLSASAIAHHAAMALGHDLDARIAVLAERFDGIAQKIEHDAVELLGVGIDHQRAIDRRSRTRSYCDDVSTAASPASSMSGLSAMRLRAGGCSSARP